MAAAPLVGAAQVASVEGADAELDALMERYARGEDAAFSRLHAALAPRVLRFLRRLTNGSERAADLTQDTFLRLHRSRGSFDRGATVLPWVFTIARNVFRDDLRRARTEATDDDADGAIDGAVSSAGTGEELALAAEAAHVVRDVLARLPVSQREAFVLLRFESMSVREAADVLDTTPTAVKLRAFRAYEAIRAGLAVREGS